MKNTRMKKTHIKEKLQIIADKVANRGVFVVVKDANSFVIQEYISKRTVLKDIPVLTTAKKICDIYNNKKQLSVEAKIILTQWSAYYYKLYTDILHFKTCIKNTKDSEILTMLYARLSDSTRKLENIKSRLERF